MAEDPEKEKEELIRLLEDAEPGAKQVESMGQAMVESARFVQDIAKPLARSTSRSRHTRCPQENGLGKARVGELGTGR